MKTPRPLTVAVVLLLASFAAFPCVAQAPNPVGYWVGTYAKDSKPTMAESGRLPLCFRADNSFYILGFPDSVGRWFQKGINSNGNGDRVRAFFNTGGGNQNGSFELDFTSFRAMAGAWTIWRDNTPVDDAFYRINLTRESLDCPPLPALTPEQKDSATKNPRDPAKVYEQQ